MMRISHQLIVAASLLAVPASVQAADNIDCISSGYSAQEQALLDGFVADFTIDQFNDPTPPTEMVDVVGERAELCAANHGWSDAAVEAAMMMEISALSERGLRLSAPESAAIVDRVDTDLSAGDRSRLWGIIDKLASDSADQPSESDFMFLGLKILQLGADGSDKTSSEIGALLALMSMQRTARSKFPAL